MLGAAIRAILLADSVVSGLVGSRIYPLELPLNCTFPALSYSFPSNPYRRVARPARCQISCWSRDYTQCDTLQKAVETALNGYAGTVLGVNIEGIFPISPYDLGPDEAGLIQIPYDFKILYRTQ